MACSPPALVFAGPSQLCVSWSCDGVEEEAEGARLGTFELAFAPLAALDAAGGAAGSHRWTAAPWNGVMDMQPPPLTAASGGAAAPERMAGALVPCWTAIVEGLEPDSVYVIRARAVGGDWCVPSEPLMTLSRPQAATATWTDGSAAVGAPALDRNPSAAGGVGGGGGGMTMLTAEQLLARLEGVVVDDDSPISEETKRLIVETIVLSEAESDGQLSALAGQWLADSLAASGKGTAFKGKVKTLHFICEVLTRRYGVTIFRQAVKEHGERTLVELTSFSCADDPTHGSKPIEWVRVGAKRTLQMLQDRLVDVSPRGEFKVAARKKHTSKIELRPFQRVRWAFKMSTARGEITFCARLSVELNNGWDTSAILVEPRLLSAADGTLSGEYSAGDRFQRCLVTFEWDNTASKLSARTVSYRLEVSFDKEACARGKDGPSSELSLTGGSVDGAVIALSEGTPPSSPDRALGGGGGAVSLSPLPSAPSSADGSRHRLARGDSATSFLTPRPRGVSGPSLQQQQTADARRAWVEEWLPKWEVDASGGAAVKDGDRSGRRMRGLLHSGVPPALRARVWSLALGNTLEITKDQFEIMVATAKATADITADENGRVATTRMMIATDLHRTVGKIGFERFAQPQTAGADAPDAVEDGSGGDDGSDADGADDLPEPVFVGALKEVLEAFMHFKPEAGYTQGLSFVVATLLIHTATAPPVVIGGLLTEDEDEHRDEDAVVLSDAAEPDAYAAFRLMANLLEDSTLMVLFALDGEQMQVLFGFFDELFASALPALHAHFAMHDIEPQLYLVEWIFTLFSKCLPPSVAGWIWDHICVVGEHYIFSAALGLLQSLQPQLLLLEDFTLATLLKDVVRARLQSEGGHSEEECVSELLELFCPDDHQFLARALIDLTLLPCARV